MPISLNCQFANLNANTMHFAASIQDYLYSMGKYIVEVKPPVIHPPQIEHPQSEIHIKDLDSGELLCRMWVNNETLNGMKAIAKYMDGSKYGVDFYSSHGLRSFEYNLAEEAHKFVETYFKPMVAKYNIK